jgi:hypothetical protein
MSLIFDINLEIIRNDGSSRYVDLVRAFVIATPL